MQIPLVAAKQLPKGDYLAPIAPQPWHLRQSVEYSVSANMRGARPRLALSRADAVLNIWLMGHNAIERGNSR